MGGINRSFPCNQFIIRHNASLAQLAEQVALNDKVTGSTPVRGTLQSKKNRVYLFIN